MEAAYQAWLPSAVNLALTIFPTNESEAKDQARKSYGKGKKGGVGRPLNCYMLYQNHFKKKWAELYEDQKVASKVATKMVSTRWNDHISEDDKMPWREAFKLLCAAFLVVHPDYKYEPEQDEDKNSAQDGSSKEPNANGELGGGGIAGETSLTMNISDGASSSPKLQLPPHRDHSGLGYLLDFFLIPFRSLCHHHSSGTPDQHSPSLSEAHSSSATNENHRVPDSQAQACFKLTEYIAYGETLYLYSDEVARYPSARLHTAETQAERPPIQLLPPSAYEHLLG
ncbi:hypothetical protein BJ165DRAFT_1411052 [Panaeolus papilionaceus]|nr:hypothetical protein BJ165DRAFT_1411052 [Panaeolus papilionaceus]